MISDRKATYLRPALLAAPPVVVVGIVCNSLMPSPAPVSAVVAANDPEVNLSLTQKTSAARPAVYRFAGRTR